MPNKIDLGCIAMVLTITLFVGILIFQTDKQRKITLALPEKTTLSG